MPLRPSSRIARSASLMKAGPPQGRIGGEGIEHALVLLLDLGGIVRPFLHRGELLVRGLAAQIVRRVGHDADVDAVCGNARRGSSPSTMGPAALAPFRTALAVVGAEIVGRFFRRIDCANANR